MSLLLSIMLARSRHHSYPKRYQEKNPHEHKDFTLLKKLLTSISRQNLWIP